MAILWKSGNPRMNNAQALADVFKFTPMIQSCPANAFSVV